jgi:hypothetical protein
MPPIDYEAEYNNRARVPEHPTIIAGWARDAQAYRDLNPPLRIAYGPSERQFIDLFHAGEPDLAAPAALVQLDGRRPPRSRRCRRSITRPKLTTLVTC